MNLLERKNVTAGKGGPLTLLGTEVMPGQKAPDFTAIGQDMKPVSLGELKGRRRIVLSVPSLDTPVCDAEVRRFNQEAAKLDGARILLVSVDTPMAQKRWCGAAGVDKVTTLSDFRERAFGKAYGTFIKENWLLARAVFVVEPDDTVSYVEYVSELGKEPDYDKLLAHLRQTVKA